MCGRYHIDEEMEEEIRRMVKVLESRLKVTGSGDIYPSMKAPVLLKNQGEGLKAASMTWGFPGRDKKQLLINARAETALIRPTFSQAVTHRRCVIPARWFYEWNPEKEKAEFSRKDGSVLYMAGFYDIFQEIPRFMILTTQANPSVQPVHHRMPLILEKEEAESWIYEDSSVDKFLKKVPESLECRQEYRQQKLPFL